MVALEEVGDLGLTDLWVSMVISGCRSAHLKVEELGMALLGATQRVKQLLESAVGIESLHFFLILIKQLNRTKLTQAWFEANRPT